VSVATASPAIDLLLASDEPAVRWHYDVLQGLLVMSRLGLVADERCVDALELLEQKRLPDGTWAPDGCWWRRPGSKGPNTELVDRGRNGPNELLTLNALRVLRAGGRL
jgi:hypothetical protein